MNTIFSDLPKEAKVATRETKNKNGDINGPAKSFTRAQRLNSPAPDPPPRSWFRRWGMYLLLSAVILFAALISDGLRREKLEFSAVVASVSGTGKIISPNGKKVNLTVGAILNVSDTVITDPQSFAIITLHDGSAVRIDQNTSLQIRMLDYTRNGIRAHTYFVNDGSTISRVSRFFGANSQQQTSSPTAVAAARGTGYQFKYIPVSTTTILQTIQHIVHFTYKNQSKDCSTGYQLSANNNSIIGPMPIEQSVFQDLQSKFRSLAIYEHRPGWLERFERRLISFINPILQSTGNGPNGLSDTKRVHICRSALQKLRDIINQSGHKPPASLNHMTLSELGADESTCTAILSAFMGGSLQEYKLTTNGGYLLSAFSRDSQQTLITITGQTNPSAENSVPENTTEKQEDMTPKVSSTASENNQEQPSFSMERDPIPNNLVATGIGHGVLFSSKSANWISPLTALVGTGALPVSLDAGEVMRVLGSFEEVGGPGMSPTPDPPALVGPSITTPESIPMVPEAPMIAALADSMTDIPGGIGMGSGGLSALTQNIGPALLTALVASDNKKTSGNPILVPEASSISGLVCGVICLGGFIRRRREH